MKKTQLQRVKYKLERDGFITRNECINLQYNKIIRLGAIILLLRRIGWNIETEETKQDTIYKLIRKGNESN